MKRITFFVLLLVAAIGLFGRLGSGVLYWDEAIYAQVSKEMIENGNWLTPHWNGHLLFHKPPLYFWATATLFRLFGISEFAARATSALSGLGVVVLSYVIARRLFGECAGVLAALVLLSSQLFISYARFGTTDTALSFFILLAVYWYLRTTEDARFWILVGVACGMGIMVKGAAGLVAPGALLLTSLLEGRASATLRNRWLWAGVACAALVVLPWHIVMYWLHGNSFLKGYFLRQVVDRATTDLHDYRHGYGYYLWVLWEFFWPWVYVLPFALVFVRKRSAVLVVLAAMVLVLYTLVQTKFQWYVLPVIPAFSIVIAGFLSSVVEKRSQSQRKLALLALVLMLFAGTYGVVKRLSLPRPEIEAGARLAKLAARDEGAIAAYPENLEMTVRYYSGRKLCADPVLSTLSYNERTECLPGEARHMIFRRANRTKIEGRFTIEPLLEDGDLIYAAITRKQEPENALVFPWPEQ